jgi:hypothetical protein
MQYHAADRPRGANGLPLYHTPGGWLAAIPQLSISPTPMGTHRVSMMLLVAPNEAKWFHHETADLAPLLDAWGADPEGTMEYQFGWKWRGAMVAKGGLSLEDLLS